MKHTQALTSRTLVTPWKVIPAAETQSRLAIIRDSQGYGVAEMYTRGTEAEQNQVANLIAAAPEMLEALEKCLPLLDLYKEGPWLEALTMAEQALKKAKGD